MSKRIFLVGQWVLAGMLCSLASHAADNTVMDELRLFSESGQLQKIEQGLLDKDQEQDYAVLFQNEQGALSVLVALSSERQDDVGWLPHELCALPLPEGWGGQDYDVVIADKTLYLKAKSTGGSIMGEERRFTANFVWKKQSKTLRLQKLNWRVMKRNSAMYREVEIDLVKQVMLRTSGSMSSPRHHQARERFRTEHQYSICNEPEWSDLMQD